MSIKDLRIFNRGNHIDLPDWIKFSFELGLYMNDYKLKYKKPLTITVSLPNELYFPLFFAMGIADIHFSNNKKSSLIKNQILNLNQGSRIIYQNGDTVKKGSVLAVEPSPAFKDEMILWIQEGKLGTDRLGISEREWMDRVTILDDELTEVKRSRKVSQKKQLGLESNAILSKLYSSTQLNKVSFYPGDSFYIVGNMAQINENINEKLFCYNNTLGSIKDFLYLDNSNSYTNGKLFSSRMKKSNIQIDKEIPVIYTNLNSYIKQSKCFLENPRLIIFSRSDNESRIMEVREEIKVEMLQGNCEVITYDLINYLKASNTSIPNGIEMFAWR